MSEPRIIDRRKLLYCVAIFVGAIHSFCSLVAQDRVPWTTSKINGSPEPPLPYVVERIFPEVEFKNPVDFALEPGTGAWLILQLDGKLFRIQPQEHDQPQLIHDAHEEIDSHDRSYGLECHPDYIKNRKIYLSYIINGELENGTHVSEFRIKDDPTRHVDSGSERRLITWHKGGHNGGCLKFGPDGYLYISAGDGTAPFPPDGANVGQDLGDLRSTIMRIDVDRPTDLKPYSIPPDNPFLHLADARPEVWAFGFRNPWKMSFDSKTGDLWCGDVGWELWELIFNIEKAGNYGWSIKEGSQPIRTDLKQGPGEIIPPIVQHAHTEAASMTGGYVYYGSKLAELTGQYIYGDYVSGKIWALSIDRDGNSVTKEIADTSLAIITFGVDAAGELIAIDYAGGLYRIAPNTTSDTSQEFPRLLSETGLFHSLDTHLINQPGVIDYYPNATMWQDGASSGAVVAIPGTDSIVVSRNHQHWKYPTGTVFAKTIAKWTVHENILAHRRIETQVLHFDGKEWNPYTYLWNDEQSDANLVNAAGATKKLFVPLEGSENDVEEFEWRVHSRSECMSCHVKTAGFVIGFDLPNLERETPLQKPQLDLLSELKIFDKSVPKHWTTASMRSILETGELDLKARSYLAINCAHCHRRGGGGTAAIEFPFNHAIEKTNSVGAIPTQGTFGIPNARVIAPGDPNRSVLYYRMATVGRGHMPHIGATTVDRDSLGIIAEWISGLDKSHEPESLDEFDYDKIFESILDARPQSKFIERVLNSTPNALALAKRVGEIEDVQDRREIAGYLANKSPPHVRGVFESFLPVVQRQQTLGLTVELRSILEMQGDIENGKALFHSSAGMTCRNCHQIFDIGKEIGPDLSKIGGQRSRVEILKSILEPSQTIDPKFRTRTIVNFKGQVISGLVVSEAHGMITLRDATGKNHEIMESEVEEMVTQPRSLMPDLLAKEMTAQELVDLLDYLVSLK